MIVQNMSYFFKLFIKAKQFCTCFKQSNSQRTINDDNRKTSAVFILSINRSFFFNYNIPNKI